MQNPFEFLKIDPTTDIRQITEICLQRSQSAGDEQKAKIRDALQELRDEKKRLHYALFAYHRADTQDSDWHQFLEQYKRFPLKLRDILPKDIVDQDFDWKIVDTLLTGVEPVEKDISPEELEQIANTVDFEKLTVEFLQRHYAT